MPAAPFVLTQIAAQRRASPGPRTPDPGACAFAPCLFTLTSHPALREAGCPPASHGTQPLHAMVHDPYGLTVGCRFAKGSVKRRQISGERETISSGARAAALGPLDFFGGSPEQAILAGAEVAGTAAPSRRKKRARQRAGASEHVEEETPASAESEGAVPAEIVAPSARQVAEANQLRKALRIHAYGNNIPPPVQSAHALSEAHGLRPFLYRNIMTAGEIRLPTMPPTMPSHLLPQAAFARGTSVQSGRPPSQRVR